MLKSIVAMTAILGGVYAPLVSAQLTHPPGLQLAQAAPATAPMAEGEVRKVDKEAGKLTLKHGPIPNLDMPEMTMVFRVKDPAMLDQVKAGDKVRFAADRVGGQFTVIRIEPMK